MSYKHPLDDTFKRKLRNYEINAPNDLWQKIDAKRSWQQKLNNRFRYYKGGLAIAATLLLSIGAWWLTQASPSVVEIGHFPIGPTVSVTQEKALATISKEETVQIPAEKKSISSIPKTIAAEPTYTLNIPAIQAQQTIVASAAADSPKAATDQPQEPLMATFPSTGDISLKGSANVQEAFVPTFAAMTQLPSLVAMPLETGLFKTDLRCESFKTGKRHWYGELSTGTTTSLRDLHAREGEFIPYAASRAATESAQFSYNTELRLSIISPNGFAFRTGFNYTQLNDKFNYVNENEKKIIITNVYGSNGQIISQDTSIVTGTRRKITNNRFQLLDVPLILGYELNYKDVTFAFNAGMYLNLSYQQKGDFLSPIDQEPTSFSSDEIDTYPAYRQQIGMGWYGSIGMYYRMNPRTHVYLEPSLRMYTQSGTIDEYPLKQNYALGSLNIGLRRVIF
ncbi:MAG: hypothetical protein R2828_23980 [Saprospiraceae bacterium]